MAFKIQIGNIDTGETLTAQFVPTELKESYGAEYGKLAVPGLSHKILQFGSSENAELDIELEFNGLLNPSTPVAEQRKFLMSMLVPSRKAQGVSTGAPAKTLFFWPELFSLVCRLTKLDMTHTYFLPTGGPAIFKAKLRLEEARDTRLYAEDVRANGTMRGS